MVVVFCLGCVFTLHTSSNRINNYIFCYKSMTILFAGKLGVPVESVQHGIEGLMFLMTESSKYMVTHTNCP